MNQLVLFGAASFIGLVVGVLTLIFWCIPIEKRLNSYNDQKAEIMKKYSSADDFYKVDGILEADISRPGDQATLDSFKQKYGADGQKYIDLKTAYLNEHTGIAFSIMAVAFFACAACGYFAYREMKAVSKTAPIPHNSLLKKYL
jgi:hypothetical protein